MLTARKAFNVKALRQTNALLSLSTSKSLHCRAFNDATIKQLNSKTFSLLSVLSSSLQRHLSNVASPRYDDSATIAVRLPTAGGKDSTATDVNATWLRENCQCALCYSAFSHQRNVLFHQLPADGLKAQAIEQQGDKLQVRWSDGHQSTYSLQWLSSYLQAGNHGSHAPAARRIDRVKWNAANFKVDALKHPYDSFMIEDKTVSAVLGDLLRWGVSLVSQCPRSPDVTRKAVERVSFIQQTLYGDMWMFSNDRQRDDTAYTDVAIGAHTDATYLTSVPGIQVFHILHHDGEGGETLLVDGFNAAKTLKNQNPKAFELLCTTPVHHSHQEMKANIRTHVRHLTPVLGVDPTTGQMEYIRYNPYDREPISSVPISQLGPYYSALAQLAAIIEHPANEVWLKLRTDIVIFIDNWRVLHGRTSYTGKRVMEGCYLPRDDWLGAARVRHLI